MFPVNPALPRKAAAKIELILSPITLKSWKK